MEMAADREPTASTVDTFDNSSLGSTAFDMDFISPAVAATSNANTMQSPVSTRRQQRNNNNLDNFFVESNDRFAVNANTNTPPKSHRSGSSNTSYRQQQQQPLHAPSSGSVNSAQSHNSSSIGAAARRRMRSHMRGSNGGGSSNSSVGSSSQNVGLSSDSNDAFPAAPESPMQRSVVSQRSTSSNLSASKNRLAAYQQRKNSGGSGSFHQHSSSFVSTGGTSHASSNNSGSSPGLFDADNNGGFTFDAFGLDQSQVDRDISAAMQDLAGEGLADFSVFVDRHHASSKKASNRGNLTDQSDDDTFGPQHWDSSPASSRNASPVPSQYHSGSDTGEGFVDGFRVSQSKTTTAQPMTNPPSFASPSSSAARRLQRSMKRGASTGLPSHQQEQQQRGPATTPPRWQAAPQHAPTTPSPASRQSATPTHSSPGFPDPGMSNPWKEDPWASDDGNGGNGSDFFSVGDTQSDVQDYRGSYGSATTGESSNKRLSYSSAKSDVGASMNARLAPSNFYPLPPEESRPPRPSYGSSNQQDDDDQSDDSDDMSQMQEDLTREFARDFVRRVSPTNRQSPQKSTNRVLNYGSSLDSRYQPQGGSNRYAHSPGSPSVASQHSSRRDTSHDSYVSPPESREIAKADEDSNDRSDYAGNSDYHSHDVRNRSPGTPTAEETSNTSRFSNFRSKYESRTRGNMSSTSQPSATSNQLSFRARQALKAKMANDSSLASQESTTEDSIAVVESAEKKSSHSRSFRQAYGGVTADTSASAPVVSNWKSQQNNVYSESEEKKDDDDATSALSSPPPKVGSLKARWEAQTRQVDSATAKSTVSKPVVVVPGKARESIGKMDNSFEMLTPAMVEARRQEKQKQKFQSLRKSMGVVDERPSPSSKSEVGVSFNNSSVLDRALNRARRESPRAATSPSYVDETKSDGGSTPSFLANIKLRKVDSPGQATTPTNAASTPNSTDRATSFREIHATNTSTEHCIEESTQPFEAVREKPVERKLTYRERRELELQRQKEEKAKHEAVAEETPKKDVASLIRKRIAANKQRNGPAAVETPSEEDLTNIRGRRVAVGEEMNTPSLSSPRPASRTPTNNMEATAPDAGSRFESRISPSTYASREANPGIENEIPDESNIMPSPMKSPSKKLEQFLSTRTPSTPPAPIIPSVPDVARKVEVPDDVSQSDVKSMLSSFLGSRAAPALPLPAKEDDTVALKKHHVKSPTSVSPKEADSSPPPPPPPSYKISGSMPALKDDPKFERYFRMLKMGLPLEVAKHAMVRDGLDPSVLDLDPEKPIGVPLKEDPKFEKYFKMVKIGISMEQVKHSMERDGLNPAIMDQDHNLPVITVEKRQEKKTKDTHRRARLHWKTIGNVVRNSLWAKVEDEVTDIDIDEEEFNELFKADLKGSSNANKAVNHSKKKGAAVRVIDSKRANNGGIILARLKMTHDEMADAVDRIDSDVLSAEQIENIIEYLPTKEEREALEKYMLEGGQDAAEKFDGLCECEKFMVSMMTVKHAKRKIRALLFKLQFMSCMESIAEDAQTIDNACDELSHSNRFRQLMGIILQFGNRLNTAGVNSKGKAGAFTLDSLLKLKEAKAFDKKTTFLHYIILIVQRNNEILLKYYDDLPTVLKADKVFWDQCQQDLEEVENQLENVRRISLYEAKMKKQFKLQRGKKDSQSDDESLGDMDLSLEEEVELLRATPSGVFTLGAIKQVSALRDKIDRTNSKFTRVLEYFGEETRKMQPHELFNTITVFTRDFQKAKEEVFSTVHKRLREDRKKARNQTPKQKNGLPPTGPERSSAAKPMVRASDHQPNMSSMFNQIQQRGPSSDGNGTSSSTNRPQSAYRNMQYQPRIPEESTSSPSPSSIASSAAAAAAKASLRQKAARRHQNEASMASDNSARPNIALAPHVNPSNPPLGGPPPQPSTRSPRDALRNRRRLEAMRARHQTQSTAYNNSNRVPGV
ncbi:MAG: hypothetical protein SGILL_002621 [Bacillariaceae sp.]